MRSYLIVSSALLCACGITTGIPGTYNTPDAVSEEDAGGTVDAEVADMYVPPVPVSDAGMVEESPPLYQPCVQFWRKTTTYCRVKPHNCLTADYCRDSNGRAYLQQYEDPGNSQTNGLFKCNWQEASDDVIRCLPVEWVSSPTYEDPACQTPMVLMAPGVGIGIFGTTQYPTGKRSYNQVNGLGSEVKFLFPESETYYLDFSFNKRGVCTATPIFLPPGRSYFYYGPEIVATAFIAK